jgi:acyl-CoA thioester hydrolase
MFIHTTKLRVRYAETDQMGYMYYGNYAQFYEVGRVEMLRSLGMTYKSMEESGIMMPVLELKCKFIKPALYDEEITVKVKMAHLPSVRIHFKYELYNEKQELINEGETTLVFIDIKRNKPCLPPKNFLDRLQAFFN